MKQHEDFIKKFATPYGITHVYSGEAYGDRLAEALGAAHVRMEKIFAELPLSATILRKNPELYRHYVQEKVYEDLQKFGDIESSLI